MHYQFGKFLTSVFQVQVMKSSFFIISQEHLFLSFRCISDIALKIRLQPADVASVESPNETVLKILAHLRFALFKVMCHSQLAFF